MLAGAALTLALRCPACPVRRRGHPGHPVETPRPALVLAMAAVPRGCGLLPPSRRSWSSCSCATCTDRAGRRPAVRARHARRHRRPPSPPASSSSPPFPARILIGRGVVVVAVGRRARLRAGAAARVRLAAAWRPGRAVRSRWLRGAPNPASGRPRTTAPGRSPTRPGRAARTLRARHAPALVRRPGRPDVPGVRLHQGDRAPSPTRSGRPGADGGAAHRRRRVHDAPLPGRDPAGHPQRCWRSTAAWSRSAGGELGVDARRAARSGRRRPHRRCAAAGATGSTWSSATRSAGWRCPGT